MWLSYVDRVTNARVWTMEVLMYTDVTSRPPLELDSAFMRGSVHYLLRLPGQPDVRQLTKLIAGDQLAVSSDGHQAAALVPDASGGRVVMHTGADLPSIAFHEVDDTGRKTPTRILHANSHSALVWGSADGDRRPGIWYLLPQLASKVAGLDQLASIYGGPDGGVFSGTSRDNPGQITFINERGCLTVKPSAQVTALQDGSLLVLEAEGDLTYAYRVSASGQMTSFTIAPLGKGERAVQLLSLQGRFVLAGRSEYGSWLREFGKSALDDTVDAGVIHGDLEAAWNAPGEQSIALLVHMRTRQGVVRKLQLGSRLVYEGPFTMNHEDVYWSPSGKHFAAVISKGGDGTKQGEQLVVTTRQVRKISRGRSVRNLLISDKGVITAMILTDGHYDHPIIGKRPHDSVPYAWNLHQDPSGAIVYNTVHASYVMRWEDNYDL